MRGKRSSVSIDRQKQLLTKSAVYMVTCNYPECDCRENGNCDRGFFSLFLQALYGIGFAKEQGLPYFINFGDKPYSYSSEKKFKDLNFWNYYFDQPHAFKMQDYDYIANLHFENYPLRIWDRSNYKKLNGTLANLSFKTEVRKKFQEVDTLLQGKKVIGIHLRGTDHLDEVAPISFEKVVREIDRLVKDEKSYLFVATDEQALLDKLVVLYGDKVLCNVVERSSNKESLHGVGSPNGYELGLDALQDCYALSKCSFSLLSPSNLSFTALVFNPGLSYQILETSVARWRRLKTLSLYMLNRWGVRKW